MRSYWKKVLADILVVLMFTGCGSTACAANPVYDVSEITTTTTVVTSTSQAASTTITTLEYDDSGLVTSLIAFNNSETIKSTVNWSFDEQDAPKSFFMEFAGQRVKVTITNRYENGVLKEAVVSDLIVDGASMATSGELKNPEKLDSARLGILLQALKMVEHFVGYQNCILRVADTEVQIRYEEGRQVYAYSVLPGVGQENFTEYLEDGSIWTANNTYDLSNESRTQTSGIATFTEANLCLRELTMSTGQGEKMSFILRTDEPITDPNMREQVRFGYIEDIRGASSAGLSEEEKAELLEMLKEVPIMLYTLDEGGRVCRSEYAPAFSALMGESGVSNSMVTVYNAEGKTVRTESTVQSEAYGSSMVTEYKYR